MKEARQRHARTLKDNSRKAAASLPEILCSDRQLRSIQALEFLHEVAEQGLFGAIERGLFAHMARPAAGGKGAEGVFVRAPEYVNPFAERLAAALPLPLEEVIHARSAR